MITTFPVNKVQLLREQASGLGPAAEDVPEGWSISAIDPMRILAVFKSLSIKPEYILRAYQFKEGGNGNGVVWAMPISDELPAPEDCLRMTDLFLEPPKPPTALDDVMDAIDGNGTPWSYLSASIFQRELGEFGAMWHGCSWGTHDVLGSDPWQSKGKNVLIGDDPFGSAANWTWTEAKPENWLPQADLTADKMLVTFLTYSALHRQAIWRHIDRYSLGSYRFATEARPLAEGQRGYVF